MTIINGTIAVSNKAIKTAMETVKVLIPRRTHLSIEKSMKTINKWFQGWASYYKMTQYPSQLFKIEAHIRRRLRARFVCQQKKRRHLFNKLRKLGVNKSLARKAAYSKCKTWAMSHTRALERAYPVKDFIEKYGQKIFSDKGLNHWFDVKQWIRLT